MGASKGTVVVVGCGRLGALLAERLCRRGAAVALVDRDASAIAALPEALAGKSVAGEALDPSVLRRAGIENASCLIATTASDESNLAVALIARTVFGIGRAIARVRDPGRDGAYDALGIETVCPTLLVGETFFKLVYRALGVPAAGE
jgi:trk system potassium uptake protein TrkA